MPKLNTVGISSDIDALMSSIKSEEEEKKKNLKPLTDDSLKDDFDTFKASLNSKSILATLQNVIFEISTNMLTAFVPTQRAKEVLADGGYFIGFSDRFKNENIDYKIEVNVSKFPGYEVVKEVKNTNTPIHRYEKIVNKNPDIELLRTTLGLKFEL